MPYKDRATQNEYQRKRKAALRAEFFRDKSCADCGTQDRLEIDHNVKADKVDHKVWTWTPARRDAELAKCTVRCRPCHSKRHVNERLNQPRAIQHGTRTAYRAGCRCESCKQKGSEANKRFYANRKRRIQTKGNTQ